MVTPLEIQKHRFTVKWKGYDQEEVRHFLYALADEFEKLIEKHQKMAREMAILRDRVHDMSSREKVLKDTLVTAQQIKAEVQEHAEREAEILLKEAQLKADTYHEEAKRKVDQMQRQLVELRRVRDDVLAEAEMMVSRFTHFVEAEREVSLEEDKLQTFLVRNPNRAKQPTPLPSPIKKIGRG